MPSIASVAPSGHSSPCSATSARRPPSQADSESSNRPSRSKMTAWIKRGTRESNPNLRFWRPPSSPLDQSPGRRDCSRSVRRMCEHTFVCWFPPPHDHYAYLLGLYLGDGHVARAHRSYQLRIVLDGIYPRIIEACAAAIDECIRPRAVYRRTVRGSRGIVVEATSKHLPEVFPQLGRGMKHDRPIVLLAWQRIMV